MKKNQSKITLTLTISETDKQYEGKYECLENVAQAWAPIIIGCLEYYVDLMNKSLISNCDRVVRITDNGNCIQYVSKRGYYQIYNLVKIQAIEALVDKLKTCPKIQLDDFKSIEIKYILTALKYVNRAIGPKTDEEIIKNVSFDQLYDRLLNKFNSSTIEELTSPDETEDVHSCKEVAS